MLRTFKTFVLIHIISVTLPNCRGILDPCLEGRTIGTIFTPFNEDGTINFEVIGQQAEYLANRKIKTVQIFGFYGLGPIIGLEYRKAMALVWAKEAARQRLKLIIEIGDMPFPDQLELAKFCSQLNVAAISAFPLLTYEAKNKEEIVKDYQRLSDAAPNLTLLYRSLTETGPQITAPQAYVALIGRVKTFSGAVVSINDVLDVRAAVPSVSGYLNYIYGTRYMAAAHITNMNGSINNAVNLCPKAALEIEARADAGKIKEAMDLQRQLDSLFEAIILSYDGDLIDFNSRSTIDYLRAGCEIITGWKLGTRLPFEKVTETERNAIRSKLEQFKDFINCYCS